MVRSVFRLTDISRIKHYSIPGCFFADPFNSLLAPNIKNSAKTNVSSSFQTIIPDRFICVA